MQPPYAQTPTRTLLDQISRLEALLIQGAARDAEIDTYVAMQLEMAGREVHDPPIDPRD